jgi:hypothetical protein
MSTPRREYSASECNRAGRCNHVLPGSDKLGEAGELANVIMFMLTPPRGMTIRDVLNDADQFRSLGHLSPCYGIRFDCRNWLVRSENATD